MHIRKAAASPAVEEVLLCGARNFCINTNSQNRLWHNRKQQLWETVLYTCAKKLHQSMKYIRFITPYNPCCPVLLQKARNPLSSILPNLLARDLLHFKGHKASGSCSASQSTVHAPDEALTARWVPASWDASYTPEVVNHAVVELTQMYFPFGK